MKRRIHTAKKLPLLSQLKSGKGPMISAKTLRYLKKLDRFEAESRKSKLIAK